MQLANVMEHAQLEQVPPQQKIHSTPGLVSVEMEN